MRLWSEQTRSSQFCWRKPAVWGSLLPVLDQEVCMPNWSLAAGGDWLHYKEATTVSCWCLTCKSWWSKHTLCRGRQHCVGPHWDAYITSTHTERATPGGCTARWDADFARFTSLVVYVNLIRVLLLINHCAWQKVRTLAMRTKTWTRSKHTLVTKCHNLLPTGNPFSQSNLIFPSLWKLGRQVHL